MANTSCAACETSWPWIRQRCWRRRDCRPTRSKAAGSPTYALHPRFVSERARLVLRPPASVTLSYRDGVLTAKGTAPTTWVAASRDRAPALAGVRRFEFVGDAIDAEDAGGTAEPPPPPHTDTPPAPVRAPTAPASPSASAAPPVKTAEPPARPAETGAAKPATPSTPSPPVVATPSERRLIEQIEVSSLEFSPLHADLVPGQEASIRRLSTLFRELNEIVHARGARASVEIIALRHRGCRGLRTQPRAGARQRGAGTLPP